MASPWKFLQVDGIYCVLLLFFLKRDQMIQQYENKTGGLQFEGAQ